MKTSLVLSATLLFAAAPASAAAKTIGPWRSRTFGSVTSSTSPGLATCATVRADLERLQGTIGIPDNDDDAKAMITDELNQVECLLHDVDDLTPRTTGPCRTESARRWRTSAAL